MKSFVAITFAAAVAALPSSKSIAATTCPGLNNGKVLSNNNQAYETKCDTWVDSDTVLRITTTEIGYQGCLTACDGTIGCGVTQFIATDDEQVKGSCTLYPEGATLKTGASNSWTVAVKCKVDTVPVPPTPQPIEFGGIAIRSGSPIQFSSINANGSSFWINKDTSVYTPENTIPAPKDPYTTFLHNNATTTLSLASVVPGGQQVYVDTTELGNGELKFTVAHSGDTGDAGVVNGFSVYDGHLKFEDNDFYACPLGAEEGDAYGIYAVSRVKGSNAGANCLGFLFRAQEGVPAEAVWEYV